MYTQTRNDLATFLTVDAFWDRGTPVSELLAALHADNWQVQLASLAALGDRRDVEALSAVEALLETQDTLGVYDCPDEWDLNSTSESSEKEIWRCRYRVKQAALIAILRCVEQHGPGIIEEALLEKLHHYAISQEEDYPVRVAACELLGALKHPTSGPVLAAASKDGEWCTATVATRALASKKEGKEFL